MLDYAFHKIITAFMIKEPIAILQHKQTSVMYIMINNNVKQLTI